MESPFTRMCSAFARRRALRHSNLFPSFCNMPHQPSSLSCSCPFLWWCPCSIRLLTRAASGLEDLPVQTSMCNPNVGDPSLPCAMPRCGFPSQDPHRDSRTWAGTRRAVKVGIKSSASWTQPSRQCLNNRVIQIGQHVTQYLSN